MTRLYQLITEPQFSRCTKTTSYRRLLFSLCFFHSILLERRKFLQLGWNIVYGFNDSDFEVSENLLSLYLDEYEETPWEALKYLISGVNYGGHVTDDWDRRLLGTYINDYFCEQALTTQFYKLSSLDAYYIPRDGPLPSYKEFISLLPTVDHPEAFGQHPNADIASQITEARTLFDTLLSLQPQVTQNVPGGQSREDKVLELLSDVRQKIPQEIDYEGTVKVLSDDPNPLNVVLLQEIQRYNALISTIRSSLQDLEYGIQGLVVMSTELEEIFTCIYDARVPPLWEKVSVDSLSWEFIVSTVDDNNLVYPPKDGVWIRGLYLEGAGWDKKNSCLMEAEPMQLVCPLPTVHFRPTESKKKSSKDDGGSTRQSRDRSASAANIAGTLDRSLPLPMLLLPNPLRVFWSRLLRDRCGSSHRGVTSRTLDQARNGSADESGQLEDQKGLPTRMSNHTYGQSISPKSAPHVLPCSTANVSLTCSLHDNQSQLGLCKD
ncbi:hypothetical protein AB205_0076880 [Aquarana catesbeiana]|uniref:Dynein heavy chain AAA lid domain-containing protein n=1 Tax=Aquarana catesbeiana TaxID=8400 RepID=A0A2G9SGV1_AQUCT|nr:hypothetical protein AB205_0076880 [Aquarana catesbeiana]